MADTTERVRAGQTVSLTYTPASVTGTFTARMSDAAGRTITPSVTVNGSDITVTVTAAQWYDGRPGLGRLEVKQVDGNTTSFPITRRLRILPGVQANDFVTDYSDY